MIIFDLDGTLANCEHRRHFVEPLHPKNIDNAEMLSYNAYTGELVKAIGWKPDWKAFYEACDQDTLIEPVASLWNDFEVTLSCYPEKIQIWSGRCESVREKTQQWLDKYLFIPNGYFPSGLKMRPIGDNIPDDQLKERWLDEALAKGEKIEFVFDDSESCCNMWNRRGIMCFLIKDAHGCNKDH